MLRTVLLLLASAALLAACSSDDAALPTAPHEVSATLEVAPRSVSLPVGGTATLRGAVLDARGRVDPHRAVTWIAMDPGVATVDGDGRVTAVAPGITAIVATDGALRSAVAIRVGLAGAGPWGDSG